jgi:hypothetical protein
MFDVLWLSGEMNNVMARIAAYFVIMCPYCAHMCILGWLTMLQKEVLLFLAQKSHFLFLRCQIGVFCEATTKLKFHIGTKPFKKILDHLRWNISQPVYLKPFRLPLMKKINSCQIDRRPAIFEL